MARKRPTATAPPAAPEIVTESVTLEPRPKPKIVERHEGRPLADLALDGTGFHPGLVQAPATVQEAAETIAAMTELASLAPKLEAELRQAEFDGGVGAEQRAKSHAELAELRREANERQLGIRARLGRAWEAGAVLHRLWRDWPSLDPRPINERPPKPAPPKERRTALFRRRTTGSLATTP